MWFFDYIFLLLVEPLRLLFEVIFFYAYKFTGSAGISIIAMSLVINFLLLPLYFRADKLEKEQNLKKKFMEPWIKRIKSAFKGDERVMMIHAYYRENDYHTTDVFKESVSLFLQIPFFVAAYSFLSGLQLLHGVSLGPIADLGLPDALIKTGSISINLLPVLMTVINIISGFIYSEKGQFKDKIKLILIALVFLVLLYDSPAGLVFYWTLNNLFSLMKNIVVHYKKPAKENLEPAGKPEYNVGIVLLSGAVLAVLTGLMIPADIVSENPAELVNTFSDNAHSPVLYMVSSSLIAIGVFLIWIPLFYYLTRDRSDRIFKYLAPSAAACAIVNYILFNKNFGLLSKKLVYELDVTYTGKEIFLNILANVAVILAVVFLMMRFKKTVKAVMAVILVTVIVLSGTNTGLIIWKITEHNYYNTYDPEDVAIPLTSTGQNVILIMMDRMMGPYLPYIFNECPELEEQFDGFTYYPNIISYGGHTNFAAPALYGGYEYTPARLNARSDELLVDKHNESLRVLPTIFRDNDWTVTVTDAAYANYEWIPDNSIFDDLDGVTAFNMTGTFNDRSELLVDAGEELETRLNRNMFCFGIMKSLPYFLQPSAYAAGTYDYIDFYYEGYRDESYVGTGLHTQIGLYGPYVEEYMALEALTGATQITDDPRNCYFEFTNGTTHEVCLLQEPEYLPAPFVDNYEYDESHMDRFAVDGVEMHMDDFRSYASYQCNLVAFRSLGIWFDYLRDNGLWDNTRIIIVSDHGYDIPQFDDLIMTDPEFNVEGVYPMLLVKDFGSTGFTVSDEFMTNADTPFLTLNGIIDNPVNPYTGNPITEYDKTGEHLIYISEAWNVNFNNGTQFEDPEGYWLRFEGDNIFDDSNWHYYEGEPN